MQNDRDRQNRHYGNYYPDSNERNSSYRNSGAERDYDNNWGSDRNQDPFDSYIRHRNFGFYERDRHYSDNSYRGDNSNQAYEDRRNRYSDSSYNNRQEYENRGYERSYDSDYDRNRNTRYNRDFDRERNYNYQYRDRDNDRYNRNNTYSIDRVDYRRDDAYDRNRNFESDRDYGRNQYDDRQRYYARDYDYDRDQDYARQEPRSVKDKYSSSSLHYSGITSLGEGDERNRDRYEGSRYIGNQRSDRRFAGSGMGSSQRYRY